jgi:hypothetical protein
MLVVLCDINKRPFTELFKFPTCKTLNSRQKTLIDQQQAINVLCFRLFPERTDKKTVIPRRLKDIDSASFHRRSCLSREAAGNALNFPALLTERTGTGKHGKGLIIAVFEEVTLHRNQSIK